jgi:hypothetical protein
MAQLATSDGCNPVVHALWEEGGLFVHNGLVCCHPEPQWSRRIYIISHSASGRSVALATSKMRAIASAKRLLPLAQWWQPYEALSECPSLSSDVQRACA